MTEYSLRLSSSAEKELDALDDPFFSRVDAKILALEKSPRPSGAKKLKGLQDTWRIRVGDYRVIYTVDDADHVVTVVRVAHRSRAY